MYHDDVKFLLIVKSSSASSLLPADDVFSIAVLTYARICRVPFLLLRHSTVPSSLTLPIIRPLTNTSVTSSDIISGYRDCVEFIRKCSGCDSISEDQWADEKHVECVCNQYLSKTSMKRRLLWFQRKDYSVEDVRIGFRLLCYILEKRNNTYFVDDTHPSIADALVHAHVLYHSIQPGMDRTMSRFPSLLNFSHKISDNISNFYPQHIAVGSRRVLNLPTLPEEQEVHTALESSKNKMENWIALGVGSVLAYILFGSGWIKVANKDK